MNGTCSLHRMVEVASWHPVPELRSDCRSRSTRQPNDGMRPLTAPEVVAVREGPAQEPLRGSDRRALARSDADRRAVELRPMVATDARNSLLLPGQPDGRSPTCPVPRSARSALVSPERGSMSYIELHAKSFVSFGLGASHVHELLTQAAEYGMPAFALTDTNLCSALEFARLANSQGIQPITGGELTLADGSRVTLLTKSREGYANLSRLFTLANEVDRREPKLDPAYLADYAESLVMLSGGRHGALSQLTLTGRRAEARELLGSYREWYGADSVYVELQRKLPARRWRAQPRARFTGSRGWRAAGRHERCALPLARAPPPTARADRGETQHHARPGAVRTFSRIITCTSSPRRK